MGPGLVLLVGVIYLVVALDLLRVGNYPMALVFGAYALSNVGLYLAAK